MSIKINFKNTIYIFSVLLFISCNQVSSNKTNTEPVKKNIQIFLDSCLENNPNASNNDITRKIFADTIKTRLQSQIGDTLSILSDLALEYEMNLEYTQQFEKNIGKYVVKFSLSSFDNEIPKSDKFLVTLQVLTIMEKEDVVKLIDNGKYHIQGNFVDFANCSQETGFTLPSGRCFIDYPSVSMDVLNEDKMYINLGTLILDNVKFISIKEDKK